MASRGPDNEYHLAAVAGPFERFHLGGGPGGLADFIVHSGPTMTSLWSQLGAPSLDERTTDRLVAQAGHFNGTVDELTRRRDAARIRLLRALGETPAATRPGS